MNTVEKVLSVAGGVLLALGIAGLWRVCHGADFPQLYVASRLWMERREMYAPGVFRQGIIDYVPSGLKYYQEACKLYYPPSAAILMVPLALFPFEVAKALAFAISVVALFYGMWRMLDLFAPNMRLSGRIGVFAILCQTITLRWAMESLQSAPLTMGLLALFLVASQKKRNLAIAWTSLVVCALKPILGIPFLALMLIQRRFRLAILTALILVVFNLVGFLPVGGGSAIRDYRQNIATLDECECNNPDPYNALSTERTDWVYLLNAIQPNQTLSKSISRLLALVALSLLVFEVLRLRDRVFVAEAQALLLAPITCFMLLATYHHPYDSCLLLIPLALYMVQWRSLRRWASAGCFLVLGGWYAAFRPFFHEIGLMLSRGSGMGALGLERVLGVVFLLLMLVSSLRVLHLYASQKADTPSLQPCTE